MAEEPQSEPDEGDEGGTVPLTPEDAISAILATGPHPDEPQDDGDRYADGAH